MLHEEITEKIIQAFYKVNNTLGHGFIEKVYENAMAIELRKMGFTVSQQKKIKVYYEGEEVGDYESDLIVNDLVIVETKAKESLRENPCYPRHPCSKFLNFSGANNVKAKRTIKTRPIHLVRLHPPRVFDAT